MVLVYLLLTHFYAMMY